MKTKVTFASIGILLLIVAVIGTGLCGIKRIKGEGYSSYVVIGSSDTPP